MPHHACSAPCSPTQAESAPATGAPSPDQRCRGQHAYRLATAQRNRDPFATGRAGTLQESPTSATTRPRVRRDLDPLSWRRRAELRETQRTAPSAHRRHRSRPEEQFPGDGPAGQPGMRLARPAEREASRDTRAEPYGRDPTEHGAKSAGSPLLARQVVTAATQRRVREPAPRPAPVTPDSRPESSATAAARERTVTGWVSLRYVNVERATRISRMCGPQRPPAPEAVSGQRAP